MNQSMKIQMDIKNNAQDLQNYVLDLKNWEKEMKKKEIELSKKNPPNREYPPPRNRIKRNKDTKNEKDNIKNKAKKISGYDYSAWDKYDVDKACAELDADDENNTKCIDDIKEENIGSVNINWEEEDGRENEDDDDNKLSLIDQAVYEKELGNQHVKKEEWSEAVKCYTKAISLDSKNPIYYANRSLCFLKLKNFRASEADATTALQLDKNYVKAYQRRGYARLALGQLVEARVDFEEVLNLEPKNSLMSLEINKINDRLDKDVNKIKPKSIFNHKNLFKKEDKQENQNLKPKSLTNKTGEKSVELQINSVSSSLEKTVEKTDLEKLAEYSNACSINFNKDNEYKKVENLNEILPDIFSKLPAHCRTVSSIQVPPHKRSKDSLKRIYIKEIFTEPDLDDGRNSLHTSNEAKPISVTVNSDVNIFNKYEDETKYDLDAPKTSVQFQTNWKIIKKHPDDAWKYLKKVAEKLPEILGNSLESDLFSDLIVFLSSNYPEKDSTAVYTSLLNLSKVKRFTSMIMFMSKKDKDCVKKCILELKGAKSESEILELLALYEL